MGTSVRVFLIGDNDSLQRFPLSRLERLLRFHQAESLPQHAGKRIRCAMVFLQVAGRQVQAIRNIDYFLLHFDAKGRIDRKEWEKGIRLGMDLLPPLYKQYPQHVIDAQHRFAKQRYEHEFKWKPSRKVEDAMMAAIFQSNVTNL